MHISPRPLLGTLAACPAAYGAALLGLALPIDRVDAALSATMFALLIFAMVVSWAAGAHKALRLLTGTLLPASCIATMLIVLPR